tara:strand:- start:160 stop:522 length:363 start_codon:yes stop_codon:yes gene_type:complete
MSRLTREKLLTKPFLDRKNYPYGFSRSGDFSISEAQALTKHGSLIAGLVDGHIPPQSEEDDSYLQSALGHQPPQNLAERAWLKYQQRINRPKAASIYGSKKSVVLEDDSDDDSPLELEDD